MTIFLHVSDAKLARWLCYAPPRPGKGQDILVIVDGDAYGWPIDPQAWKR